MQERSDLGKPVIFQNVTVTPQSTHLPASTFNDHTAAEILKMGVFNCQKDFGVLGAACTSLCMRDNLEEVRESSARLHDAYPA